MLGQPSPIHTHTSLVFQFAGEAVAKALKERCDWAASAHHCRSSPAGLAASIKEAFQDVLSPPPLATTGYLISLIIGARLVLFNLISFTVLCLIVVFFKQDKKMWG